MKIVLQVFRTLEAQRKRYEYRQDV